MGIYIKGMEIPILGYREIRIYPDGRVMEKDECGLDEIAGVVEQIQSHGRLIDADALYEDCALDHNYEVAATTTRINEYMQLKIDDTPTIIPAEQKGE